MNARIRVGDVLVALAAGIVVLAVWLTQYSGPIRLWPPVVPVMLDSSAVWQVPAASWELTAPWGSLSVSSASAITGLLICRILAGNRARAAWCFAALFCGLLLTVRPDQLLTGWLISFAVSKDRTSSAATLFRTAVIAVAACLLTADFGLVLSCCLPSIIGQSTDGRGRRLVGVVAFAAAAGFACFALPGFPDCAARVLRALTGGHVRELFPVLQAPWHTPRTAAAAVILIGLLVRLMLLRDQSSGGRVVVCSVLVGTALVTNYALFPAMTAVGTSLGAVGAAVAPSADRRWSAAAAVGGLAACTVVWATAGAVPTELSELLMVPQRRVATQPSQAAAVVFVTEPEQFDHLARPSSDDRTTYVIDGRWDRSSAVWEQYRQLRSDVRAGRGDAELRPDGTVAGFLTEFRRLGVDRIIAPAADLTVIRSLAMHPNWGAVSIDTAAVVFDGSDHPSGAQARRRAGNLFQFLEWPAPGRTFAVDGILELGAARDARRIAAAMVAMHLPYAAMRCLGADAHQSAQDVRRLAFRELISRSTQQCGRILLSDAICLRRVDADAVDFIGQQAGRVLAVGAVGFSVEGVTVPGPEISSEELRIRNAILEGTELPGADAAASLSDSAIRNFYEAVLNCRPDGSVSSASTDALTAEELPERLRDEGYFIAASAALLRGDGTDAYRHLESGQAAFPSSPFQPLRLLYLRHLSM